MNYEYKFEKIEVSGGVIRSKPERDYHDIIERYAKEGWRFVQIFAPGTKRFGEVACFELIFERPVN